MPRLTSEQFVESTSELLKAQCGGDITLSAVLDACSAQKGSLYHFFPGGKDELVAIAVKKMGRCVMDHMQMCVEQSETAADAIQMHLKHVAKLMDQPNSPVGLPFLALAATVGSVNQDARMACKDAILGVETILVKQLVQDGFSSRDAKALASFCASATDGAILRSHAFGDTKPLKLTASLLGKMFSA